MSSSLDEPTNDLTSERCAPEARNSSCAVNVPHRFFPDRLPPTSRLRGYSHVEWFEGN